MLTIAEEGAIYLNIDPTPINVELKIEAIKEVLVDLKDEDLDIPLLSKFFNTVRDMTNRKEENVSLNRAAELMNVEIGVLEDLLFVLDFLLKVITEVDEPGKIDPQLVIETELGAGFLKPIEETS